MKTISMFLGLINSLLAGLLVAFLMTSADLRTSLTLWSTLRIMIAASVIAIGILTWIHAVGAIHPGLLALGSLFLVALGPSAVVWTFHRAQMTGDVKYYMFLYGVSLFLQGVSLLFGIAQDRSTVSLA